MIERAKIAEIAEPLKFDLQLFAEGEGGGGESTSGASAGTSSIIPGDDYASGGPEPPENQPAELIDFEGFDLDNLGDNDEDLPELEDNAANDSGETDGEPSTDDEVPEPIKKQSPEANAAFAEMRRKAEEAEKALKARDAWVEENYGHQGIKTWEQYKLAAEEGKRQQDLYRQQEILQKPQQTFNQVFNELMEQGYDQQMAYRMAKNEADKTAYMLEMQSIKEDFANLKKQEQEKMLREQEAQQQQQEEAIKEKMTQEILSDHKKLQEEYGDIVPTDLNNLDPATIERMQKGYTLHDAWFLSNRAKIMEQKQKAASQKTLNNLNSKAHLKTEGDGANDTTSTSAIPLPADTLQMYMDSGMTEKQARAFHKKLYG